ncbi:MAG: hydroxyacylglutathione hydrolase [Proteobacteria bacterium]|nr:hydroxyacylglutathione hydrolase [Pseudomonadota bacterium]
MQIHQLYTGSVLRNFTYFIELADKTAYVIDPWDAEQTNKFLEHNNLQLIGIINTHEHWDHIQGNQQLVHLHNCEVWAHANGQGKIPGLSRVLRANELIHLTDSYTLQVLDTPGHSQAHLCFMILFDNHPKYIFTGDILFNAGVGNCHNGGDVEDLYATIKNHIACLPDDVIIYPGHEYLKNNLEFTLSREPNNKVAQQWLDKYTQTYVDSKPLTTTIADEREINTFLRLENQEIINNLSIKTNTAKEVFVALRNLRNTW